MKRPSVTINPVADRHSLDGQRIVEFTFPDGSGGLISFHTSADGVPFVNVYRADLPVHVAFTPGSGFGIDQTHLRGAGSMVLVQRKRGGK